MKAEPTHAPSAAMTIWFPEEGERRGVGDPRFKVQPMLPLKSIVKGTLNGALVFALIGIFVGAVVAMIVWPGSNLGPPVGMVYGFFWGAIIGGVLGFAYAMIRLSIRKPAVAHENLENHKAP